MGTRIIYKPCLSQLSQVPPRLKQNPFISYRDSITGEWVVVKEVPIEENPERLPEKLPASEN